MKTLFHQGQQHTSGHGRAYDTSDIRTHGMHQQEIVGDESMSDQV